MGTKSEWRKGKLRFYDDPMFVSVASQSTNITASGTAARDTTVIVSAPCYVGTFTTEQNMCFRAKIAGVAATSTSHLISTLRLNGQTVLTVRSSSDKKHKGYVPYEFDYSGRICNVDSSGRIAATCVCVIGSSPKLSFFGTTGSTAVGVKFTTSNLNFSATANSTLGLNVTLAHSATAPAAGTTSKWTNNVAFIEYFSG